MAEDWLADVRRYDAGADEGVVDKIVKHCGIALRSRDASLVSFGDSKETDRVRESFLKKKLARTDPDPVLDAAISSVGERMKGDNFKNRVTVYYLLTQHFDQLDVFGGDKGAAAPVAAAPASLAAASAAGTTAATGAAASATTAAAATSAAPATTPVMGLASNPGGGRGGSDADRSGGGGGRSNDLGAGCLGGLFILAAVLIAALISVWVKNSVLPEPAPEPVVAPAPATPVEPAVPDGAGVTAGERNGMPMLTVYFDTGSSEVAPDFEAVSADLRAYLDANPDASVQISGFNDPTGNAELNAELSKNRAQGVQAAIVALGLDEARTELVKPDDATTTDMSPAEARRVEITVVE